MLLTINIGNTNTSFGIFSKKNLLRKWKFSTHHSSTAEEWLFKIRALLSFEEEKIKWNDIQSVMICSVVPQVSHVLKTAFKGKKVHLISHQENFSFKIKASEPGKIGNDRLVAAQAAIKDYGTPVIIVDAGTATTINAISRRQEFLGGAIATGVRLSAAAVTQGTALLPPHLLSLPLPPKKAIATTTQEALFSGVILGHACLIDGMVAKFKTELKETRLKVVMTGGAATLLKPLCATDAYLDQDLILKGMFYLYESIHS